MSYLCTGGCFEKQWDEESGYEYEAFKRLDEHEMFVGFTDKFEHFYCKHCLGRVAVIGD